MMSKHDIAMVWVADVFRWDDMFVNHVAKLAWQP